ASRGLEAAFHGETAQVIAVVDVVPAFKLARGFEDGFISEQVYAVPERELGSAENEEEGGGLTPHIAAAKAQRGKAPEPLKRHQHEHAGQGCEVMLIKVRINICSEAEDETADSQPRPAPFAQRRQEEEQSDIKSRVEEELIKPDTFDIAIEEGCDSFGLVAVRVFLGVVIELLFLRERPMRYGHLLESERCGNAVLIAA